MTAAAQYDITYLLELAGAHPRGKRHDCPKCGGFRTITHTDKCFFCHKCQWKGNDITLRKEVGIHRHLPAAQYRQLCKRQERAHEAALRLYMAAHRRQFQLWGKLRKLRLMELLADEAGPVEDSWVVLARVYAELPAIEQELDLLESGDAATAYSVLMKAAKSK